MLPSLLSFILFFLLPFPPSLYGLSYRDFGADRNRILPPRSSSKYRKKTHHENVCIGDRPGDCDAAGCGGFCEARYVRFFDDALGGDRTLKSCSCSKDLLCSIMDSEYTGCRSYVALNSYAQKLVRSWSLDSNAAGKFRRRSSGTMREESERHMLLINANTLFCCHSTESRPRALKLRRANGSGEKWVFSSVIAVVLLVLRIVY